MSSDNRFKDMEQEINNRKIIMEENPPFGTVAGCNHMNLEPVREVQLPHEGLTRYFLCRKCGQQWQEITGIEDQNV